MVFSDEVDENPRPHKGEEMNFLGARPNGACCKELEN